MKKNKEIEVLDESEYEVVEKSVGDVSIKTQRKQLTPLDIVMEAMNTGKDIGIDQIEKLYELQERHEKNEARKAYHSAMAAFKADPPEIKKTGRVEYKQTKYDHAKLGDIEPLISKSLSKYGLSANWKTTQNESIISVTCTITHSLGHSESTTLSSAPDQSGGKNSIQAIGSATEYLRRYTLLAITGLSAKDADDDGLSSGVTFLNEKQISEITDLMNEKIKVHDDFFKWLNGSKGLSVSCVEQIPSEHYNFVKTAIMAVK